MEDMGRVDAFWVAERLGLPSAQMAYYHARHGRIPHLRLGRRVVFLRPAIENFLAAGDAVEDRSSELVGA